MQAWEDGDLCLGGLVRWPGAVSVPSPQMVLVPQSSHHWDVGFANGHHALEPGDVPRLIRRNLALMEWGDLSFAQDGVFQWFFFWGGGGWAPEETGSRLAVLKLGPQEGTCGWCDLDVN